MQDLNRWLASEASHALADRLLAYRAYLHAKSGAFAEAGKSAQTLLEQFPASVYSEHALRMLAYISWNQAPPRYRTAAGYLNRLRQRLTDEREALEAGILIADCYFLNRDYANAADAYGAVVRDAPPDLIPDVFYQQILSEIEAGRPDAAAALIDEARQAGRVPALKLWQADWNLLDSLRQKQQLEKAFSRIRMVLPVSQGGQGQQGLSPSVSLRFRWLDARLSLEAGLPQEAVIKTSQLLEEIRAGDGAAEVPDVEQLESHLLLLQGEAKIASGDKPGGIESFTLLREQYSESGPAILSYLVESRSESDEDSLVNAQQSLIDLVDRFPTSEYAPIALWEAALNAEQRGLNVHLQEAIAILEKLVTDYPDHELVYFARLKQGDLARRLNDFPTALLLYERLLSLFPSHPERFRAEMSRGDCLMALGSEDPDRFDMAAVIYERNCLLPIAPLPVRIEAGFKWAHALKQQGDGPGAEAVYWLLYDQFILDKEIGEGLVRQDASRYWAARVLLELGSTQVDKGELNTARKVYELIVRMDLPGTGLAQARIESLR